jgi:hypothetical protein
MFLSKVKIATAVALSVALVGIGFGVYQTHASAAQRASKEGKGPVATPGAPVKEDKKAEDAKDEEKINLPTGPAPMQVLASLDKDGKLVIKTAGFFINALPGPMPLPRGGALPAPGGPGGNALPGAPPQGGAGGGAIGGPPGGAIGGPGGAAVGQVVIAPGKAKIQSHTYDLDDVQILDTNGKTIDKKDLPKLLKEETVAMASMFGQPVDPLHLRVLKEGTLTFVLPGLKKGPGGIGIGIGVPGGGVVPPGLPGVPADPTAPPVPPAKPNSRGPGGNS